MADIDTRKQSQMDVARFLIRTRRLSLINETILVKINGTIFNFKMVEDCQGPLRFLERISEKDSDLASESEEEVVEETESDSDGGENDEFTTEGIEKCKESRGTQSIKINDDLSLKLVEECGEITTKDPGFMTETVHIGERDFPLSVRVEPTSPISFGQKDNNCNHQMMDPQNVTDSEHKENRCKHQIFGLQNVNETKQMEKSCNHQSLGLQIENEVAQKERSSNDQSLGLFQNDKEVEQREISHSHCHQSLGIQNNGVTSGCNGPFTLANGPNLIMLLDSQFELAQKVKLAERSTPHDEVVTSNLYIPNAQTVSCDDSSASHAFSSTVKSKSRKEAQPSQLSGRREKFGKSGSPPFATEVRSQSDFIEVFNSYYHLLLQNHNPRKNGKDPVSLPDCTSDHHDFAEGKKDTTSSGSVCGNISDSAIALGNQRFWDGRYQDMAEKIWDKVMTLGVSNDSSNELMIEAIKVLEKRDAEEKLKKTQKDGRKTLAS